MSKSTEGSVFSTETRNFSVTASFLPEDISSNSRYHLFGIEAIETASRSALAREEMIARSSLKREYADHYLIKAVEKKDSGEALTLFAKSYTQYVQYLRSGLAKDSHASSNINEAAIGYTSGLLRQYTELKPLNESSNELFDVIRFIETHIQSWGRTPGLDQNLGEAYWGIITEEYQFQVDLTAKKLSRLEFNQKLQDFMSRKYEGGVEGGLEQLDLMFKSNANKTKGYLFSRVEEYIEKLLQLGGPRGAEALALTLNRDYYYIQQSDATIEDLMSALRHVHIVQNHPERYPSLLQNSKAIAEIAGWRLLASDSFNAEACSLVKSLSDLDDSFIKRVFTVGSADDCPNTNDIKEIFLTNLRQVSPQIADMLEAEMKLMEFVVEVLCHDLNEFILHKVKLAREIGVDNSCVMKDKSQILQESFTGIFQETSMFGEFADLLGIALSSHAEE
ncbi:MAG: hypothetical protein V4485_00525 [Pseudomonadota bacterium]